METASQHLLSAVWSTDTDGRCTACQENPAGLLPALKGTTLTAWLAAHAGDGAALEAATALQNGTPFHIELTLYCMDGAMRRVRMSGLPEAGRYAGFIADVTGQRQILEEALRTAAEYRLLVENSTDLIAHCGTDGRYVSISPSYGRMIGWAAHEIVGQPVVGFLHPDDRAHATEALIHIFNGGVLPDVVEVRKQHRDGHYITLGTKACGVSDPSTGASIGAVLVSRDITRDKALILNLEKLATRDTLTGLPNRAWINDRVGHMLAQSEDRAYTTALFIDLNGFKAVNDSLGHAAGDALLKQVGERLQRCMRPGDAVARLGGDEFVVVANCSDRDAASAIARRLLGSLEAPFSIHGARVRIGAAISISLAQPGTVSTERLLEHADTAMYRAKARGDGSYQFFAPDTGHAA